MLSLRNQSNQTTALIRAGDLRGSTNGKGDVGSRPVFLAKYIPATPPPPPHDASAQRKRSLAVFGSPQKGSLDDGGRSYSPCPSPTPLFQQLYAAVAHWERVLAGSPELMKEVLGKYSADVTGGEGGEDNGLELKKRTSSMYNLSGTVDAADKLQREMSIRRRSSPGGMWLAAAAVAVKKKSEMMSPQRERERVAKH